MRKSILLFTLLLSLSVIAVSCKDSKKEAETKTKVEQTELGVEKADLAMNDVYHCIMDCENGKTYDKEGACPVCKMNLKKVEKEEEGNHQHEDGKKHEDQD
ncbi:MAG: hypothetical protein L3J25_04305 [Flavobacteriaceae bacterium]|nr:hypothetical protein [Flavobacteriaceae bacterium]